MQMVQKHRCCQIADHPGCEKSSRMLHSVAQESSRVIQKEARGWEGCLRQGSIQRGLENEVATRS
jgi:hypothetical protein